MLGIDLGALAAVDWQGLREAVFWPVLAYALIIIAQGVAIIAWPTETAIRGAFDLVIGALLISFITWTVTASPLADAVGFGSLTGFALRMKAAFDHAPPYPLAAFITIALLPAGFGAAIRIIRGLVDILRGASRTAAALD